MSYPSPAPRRYGAYGANGPNGPYAPVHSQIVIQPYRSSTAHLVIAWVITVLTVGYTLPWGIAATRNKSNTAAIAAINILLGWSLIGWVVALVMSLTSEPRPAIYVNTAVLPTQYPTYGQPATPAPDLPLAPQQYGYQLPPQTPRHPSGEPTAILPPYERDPWRRPPGGPDFR